MWALEDSKAWLSDVQDMKVHVLWLDIINGLEQSVQLSVIFGHGTNSHVCLLIKTSVLCRILLLSSETDYF